MNHTFLVKIVDPTGDVAGSFDAFKITDITWELNGWGSATFIVPTKDVAAPLLPVLRESVTSWREIQIWRDGELIFWGPAIKAEGKADFTTIRCVGLLWYLSRRYIGPNDTEWLGDPSLESLTGNWDTVDCTATPSSSIRLHGPTSLKLEPTGGAGQDAYLVSTFPFTHGGPPGNVITFDVAAWFYIDPADWSGPAIDERGLHVHCQHPGTTVFDERFEKVNNDSPRGQWTKLTTKVFAPTGETSTIVVRLYAPDAVYWDAATVRNSSYIGAVPAADLGTTVLQNVVNFGFSGPDLNMAVSCDAVGIDEERQYLTEDHENIWQIISEWPARSISDFEIVWNDLGTTRTFQSWAPRKGDHHEDMPLHVDDGTEDHPLTWTWDADLSQSASHVRMVGGFGQGPTREFGLAEFLDYLGGVQLQKVLSPPPGATIGVLQDLADAELVRSWRPVWIPSLVVPADPYLAEFALGDTFPVTADWGWIQDEGSIYRVVAKRLDPQTDSLTLTLNLIL